MADRNVDNSIQVNIRNDKDLDFPVSTAVNAEVNRAAREVAHREYGGYMARYLRALLVRDLRQRYMLSE